MADYTPQTAPPGTADDAAIAEEHGLPSGPQPTASKPVKPLTTADVKPKKAKKAPAKKAATKKRK